MFDCDDICHKTGRCPTDLTDEDWAWIAPLLPKPAKRGRKPSVDLREVVNAIRHMTRAGCGWRMLLKDFPPWQTVYWWFQRFVRLMLFRTIHFAPDDKVMQVENDYDKEVYNGDIGYVEDVDPEAGELTVGFDGRTVAYGFGELDALVPAYAATIHKSQGSEYPAVVVLALTQHYAMLQRNLLYTGATRGKGLVVLVGQKKAVVIAVRNVSGRRRWSKLDEWLGAETDGMTDPQARDEHHAVSGRWRRLTRRRWPWADRQSCPDCRARCPAGRPSRRARPARRQRQRGVSDRSGPRRLLRAHGSTDQPWWCDS